MTDQRLDLAKMEKVRQQGTRILARCPACAELGEDRKGDNLTVFENGVYACAKRQGDREHGKRILQLVGIRRRGQAPLASRLAMPHPKRDAAAPLPPWWASMQRELTRWRFALYDSDAALSQFSAQLGLKTETLRALTMPEHDGLCLVPPGFKPFRQDGTTCVPLRQPVLGIIYEGALKMRSPFGPKGPRFLMMGAAQRPWRSHLLLRPELSITEVHVTESESDCMALIEQGFEAPLQGCVALAVPSSCGWKPHWATLFKGVHLHIWKDSDEGGQKFVQSVAKSSHPFAKSIRIHQL